MDFKRNLLWGALAVVLLMLWQEWQKQNVVSETVATAPGSVIAPPPSSPQLSNQSDVIQAADSSRVELKQGKPVSIKTDVLDITINTAGADIRQILLNDYPVSIEQQDVPFRLMGEGDDMFIAQSGLRARDNKTAMPDHNSIYQSSKGEYSLADGSDSMEVVFTWQGDNGLLVDKVYTLHRGQYLIDIEYRIRNQGSKDLGVYQYRQLLRTDVESKGLASLPTYVGGVISGVDKKKDEDIHYRKVKFSEMQDENLGVDVVGGWAAMIQHYFLAALVPAQDEVNRFYTMADSGNELYTLGMASTVKNVAAGSTGQLTYQIYAGPKVQDVLAEVAPRLELSIDFGIMTIIADPLHWLLRMVHGLVGNWGWAIVIVTLMIRLALYPLQSKSAYSMAQMRKLSPRLKQLKERYGDDKQKLNQAMMDLWRKEKINPFSGCLPILIQMPFFLAFYWVILESVELRQADWILWYADLSIADPYFVLPILMGISSLVMFKLNPTTMDPMQEKMMMFMPIMLTVLFVFFPAGLVLYWTVSNIFQLGQQLVINKKVAAMK